MIALETLTVLSLLFEEYFSYTVFEYLVYAFCEEGYLFDALKICVYFF